MAVRNGFDVSDDEEEPQYPSDVEEYPVDDDEVNNNQKPQIIIPKDHVVYYSEDEEEPQYIDDYYVDDNVFVDENSNHNHDIMIDFYDEEDEVTSSPGEVGILQGFGAHLEEEENVQEEEFVNGLLNVDDFEYEFEFVDDEEEAVKGLNSVVRDFPDGFGQTAGSLMFEKRKVSAVRDFPDGFGSGVVTDKRTVSLEEVQEKSVQVPAVKKRKTSDVRDFADQGRVVVLALQAPQFCPWRDKKGCLKKGRSRVGRRVN